MEMKWVAYRGIFKRLPFSGWIGNALIMTRNIAFHALVTLMAALFQFASAAEPLATVKDGNIHLRSVDGVEKQITRSGHDSTPAISPDKKWVVFVRALPGKAISTGAGDVDAAELWRFRVDGGDPELLVAPKESDEIKEVVANFSHLSFSNDSRKLFFVTAAYATSGAVHALDMATRKEEFFMAGSSVEVVPDGEYRDCLLIEQHRYFLGGGSFDWFWLFRPDGKEVGPVGEDAGNFRDTFFPGKEE